MKDLKFSLCKKWIDLDWPSLVRYHGIDRSVYSGFLLKVKEFECISGLEAVGIGRMAPEGLVGSDNLISEIEDCLMSHCNTVYLRKWKESDDSLYAVDLSSFCSYVRSSTEWMSLSDGLIRLPIKHLVIGGETFALPDVVGYSDRMLRYGQYCDMQAFMVSFWKLVSSAEKSGGLSDALSQQLRRVRNSFVASLLLPTRTEEYEVDCDSGSKTIRRRVAIPYDRREQERICSVIDSDATWLCPILMQLVQSALSYYHSRFPGLVSCKSKVSKNSDMYVSKLGTDNAVMKYAGYPSAEAVNNESFGTILEWLHAIAMENKEYEKMKNKKK